MMGSMTVRLPNSTHEQLKVLSKQEGVSINQLVLTAVAEKVSSLRTARFLDRLSHPPSREEYEAALARVPKADPDPWDLWPADENAPQPKL
jgi:hypothetical protein